MFKKRREGRSNMLMQEFSRIPKITFLDERIRIEGVRDFTWTTSGATPRWITRTISEEDLMGAHLVTERFRSWGAAHTFVCFTTQLDPICVSIEARRTQGESFSLLKGLRSGYELMYLYGTARDLLGQRLDAKGRALEICELTLSPAQRWSFFESLARNAQAESLEPRSYNSVRRNCTTELVRALPVKLRAPLLPKDLNRRLIEQELARGCRTYDADDRPSFL